MSPTKRTVSRETIMLPRDRTDGGIRARFESVMAEARARYAVRQKPGRPRDPTSARSCKPWLEQGISQSTFYRRKAAATAQACQAQNDPTTSLQGRP